MTALQILFVVVAAVTLGSALMVVLSRNLVHSALWLILALFGVAIIFVLLSAGFLAVAQVVIYIGAIAILVIFAVMMTQTLVKAPGKQFNRGWWLAAVVSFLLFVGIAWMLSGWDGFTATAPALAEGVDPVQQLGVALVDPQAFVLPFELASVLLLAAMIGALMIARERQS